MEHLCESMVFCSKYYDDEPAMWADINTFLQILTRSRYKAIVREEERGIIVIDYNYNEDICQFGGPDCIWLDYEEYERIYNERHADDDESD